MAEKEYIEREAALESVREKLLIAESLPDSIAKRGSIFTLASMNDSLKSIPAADVRPVVPGWWEVDGHHIRCSVCSEYMCNTDREGNRIPRAFCPNCGAKMEES